MLFSENGESHKPFELRSSGKTQDIALSEESKEASLLQTKVYHRASPKLKADIKR